MADRDLTALYSGGNLAFRDVPSEAHPEGKTYVVKSPNAKVGLWLRSIGDLGMKAAAGVELTGEQKQSLLLDVDDTVTFFDLVLGPVRAELIEDGVTLQTLDTISDDAFSYFAIGKEFADFNLIRRIAELALEAGQGNGAARPNRAARRAKPTKKTTGTRGTPRKRAGSKSSPASMDTQDPTPSPGSSSGSSSARKRQPPRKASAS